VSWDGERKGAGAPRGQLTKWHHFRGAFLLCVLLVGFTGLAARLVYLQILMHDTYVAIAEEQQTMKRPIRARRGGMFDRLGRPLCVSVPVKSVFVAPKEVELPYVPLVSLALSKELGLDEDKLRNEMLRRYDKSFMWVKRRVSQREAASIHRLRLKGVSLRTEYRRTFPQGIVAPHLIGWVDVDQRGQEGLERTLDAQLTGVDGFEWLECDGGRRPLLTERARFKPAVHGSDVRLTVDAEIQNIISDELEQIVREWDPVSATVIVMEVKTGRILALDNRPTFSPVHPDRAAASDRLNRAVCACYEPGSIFKPFAMAGYLDAGLGRTDDTMFCENGLFRIRGRRLRDHRPFGWLTLSEVIEKSSNVGMAKVGLQMGPGRLFGIISAFGFGQSTDSGLPGEIGGIVTPFRKWSYYTVTSVPMGQEIAASPMQLIAAFNAIANDGVLVKPQVIQCITDQDGKVVSEFKAPAVVRRVISSETAQALIDPMLVGVVCRGTGKRANVGVYSKFGKTGTAQKLSSAGGYSHSRFVSSFLCGAPADDPRITVLVLLDEPRRGNSFYGGTVAAPVGGRITEKTLKYLGVTPSATSQGHDL